MRLRLIIRLFSVFSPAVPLLAPGFVLAQERTAGVTPAPLADSVPLSTADAGIEKDEAVRLAETHLALRNTRWGKPVDVEVLPDRYIISYETPAPELRIIGQRRVSVQRSSGLVRVRERR